MASAWPRRAPRRTYRTRAISVCRNNVSEACSTGLDHLSRCSPRRGRANAGTRRAV
jgi:hypothetical protein